jgi:PPP family 3-phenylpropionic acid transporter
MNKVGGLVRLAKPIILAGKALRSGRMWVVWCLFFFQFAAIGVYFTYLNVYYREAGLSGTLIGLINMTTAAIGAGGSFMWGYLCDQTGKPRYLIAAGACGTLLVVQFIPLVHSFGAFLGLGCLASLMSSSLGTLVDSTTLVLLGKQREDYGRYRLGGSFGYILTTLSVGFLFDRTSLRLMFPVYGLIMLVFASTAMLLPAIPVHKGERARGDIPSMIRQPAWLLFAACIFLVWIGVNASIMFLSVSLQALGADQSLIGIASVVGAIVEVPFMASSGWFLRRFGPVKLLLVAMGLMIVRYFMLGWMPTPIWAIPINTLNGPAFVFFWNSAVTYVNRLAKPSLAATAQGLLNSTISLAGVISSLLTGLLFDGLGPNGIFVVMAFCCLAAFILFGAGTLRARYVMA